MEYRSIRPGQEWLDTEGKRIQAHGGSIITIGDTFYWYGENKEKTIPGSGIWHWGVRCYASKDLYNWEDKGIIIPPNEENPNSPLHPSQCMELSIHQLRIILVFSHVKRDSKAWYERYSLRTGVERCIKRKKRIQKDEVLDTGIFVLIASACVNMLMHG